MQIDIRPQSFLLNGGTLDQLNEKYAIKARRHGVYTNLVQLKYDQINSPMSDPLVQQCRGIILDEDDDWAVIARPFDKFFNHGEQQAAVIDWPSARVQEKLDGSLMFLYWYDGAWHVASSGLPDAAGPVHGGEETFGELFWRVWEEKRYALPTDGDCTYMFEMMTKHNRVVVQHPENRIALIGIRSLHGHEYELPTDDVPRPDRGPWEIVKSYPLQSLADVEKTFETLDPLKQEGYVVVDSNFNRIKVKHPGYVAIHHMKDGFGPRRVLEAVRAGEGVEIVAHFPEWKDGFERVQAAYSDLVGQIEASFAEFKHLPSQKDFALKVKDLPCSGALFQMRAGKIKRPEEFLATMNIDNLMSTLNLEGGVWH